MIMTHLFPRNNRHEPRRLLTRQRKQM